MHVASCNMPKTKGAQRVPIFTKESQIRVKNNIVGLATMDLIIEYVQ